ncbi:arginine--tRNA ligase [Gammaproteobacteria bacterium]|nr:arginine--tRNA ligase [Gammaproteobacteria bacterium]
MIEKIQSNLVRILEDLYGDSHLNIDEIKINLQENNDKKHGDLASNIALILAKPLKKNPQEIANSIKDSFITDEEITKIEVAGPGFINFFLSTKTHSEVLNEISAKKELFGKSETKNQNVLIEYVSSNPTGPLHVGHGRGAAFGSVLGALLKEAGFKVDEEYYVNDFGRQMNILAASLWLRYAQLFNESITMTENGYQGEYLISIAEKLKEDHSDKFYRNYDSIVELLKTEIQDDEIFTDSVVAAIQSALENDFNFLRDFALHAILELIKRDLLDFGVEHNFWFSESSLYDIKENKINQVDLAIEDLKSRGFVYEKEDALWFKSSEFGDDKDRVLKRGNGEYTYFASDVAYHSKKYDRGYDRVINIWGSDHHGYTPRVQAAMEATNRDPEKLEIVYIQFANLLRAGKKVTMSTRSGEFITLRELMDEVTTEAARFFYINRKADQHLDFDLDLAKDQSKDNPLYYIQYAHARICSVLKKSNAQIMDLERADLTLLNTEKEIEIQKTLNQYPALIERAAKSTEPHLLCYYLKDLSGLFHSYYNSEKFIIEDKKLMASRLFLLKGVKQVLVNGLSILGIKAPEEM